jgi:hypothetical protein
MKVHVPAENDGRSSLELPFTKFVAHWGNYRREILIHGKQLVLGQAQFVGLVDQTPSLPFVLAVVRFKFVVR